MTIYEDGRVVVSVKRQNAAWTEVLAPGETERAASLLTEEELATAQAAWTEEIITAWAAANPDYVAPDLLEPEPPTTEERLTVAESALLELMMGGL